MRNELTVLSPALTANRSVPLWVAVSLISLSASKWFWGNGGLLLGEPAPPVLTRWTSWIDPSAPRAKTTIWLGDWFVIAYSTPTEDGVASATDASITGTRAINSTAAKAAPRRVRSFQSLNMKDPFAPHLVAGRVSFAPRDSVGPPSETSRYRTGRR